ncbi:glycosyltransferase family 2 protein [Patescibacteria group bacterium]|nr:glycosyltransferase family 2 protein [Patescibacteria group bacterium]
MLYSRISVVVPIFNEEGNLTILDRELKNVLPSIALNYEIIYVNDASTDATLNELSLLENVTVITLRRRYGQATALAAGFARASGEIIISIDGDGQNDPADIPLLLSTLQNRNVDVVTGWRQHRRERNGIRVLTNLGRYLRKIIIHDPVHDTGCTLRAYRAEAVKSLSLHGEMHRYILALLRWKGFTIEEVVVKDRTRRHGVSKYGYSKAIRGFIDLIYIWFIYKYSDRPLHLFGYLSLSAFGLGLISALLTLYDRLVLDVHLNSDGWFFLTFFLLIVAVMFFSFGIIIELIMRMYLSTSSSEKPYYIKSIITL